MNRVILIKYGELTTKKGNRKFFINTLYNNIKSKLNGLDVVIKRDLSRMYIEFQDSDLDTILSKVNEVFGIHTYQVAYKVNSDVDTISSSCLEIMKNKKFNTFKVDTKRSDKDFPIQSTEFSSKIGGVILKNISNIKVDVHNPDITLNIEILKDYTYIYTDKLFGLGGYPVGCQPRGLLMLSGGIDSPVAGYLALKRGIKVDCVYFEAIPHTSLEARNKVIELTKKLSKYRDQIKLHIVPFTEIQEEIYRRCDSDYVITIMRRMMYRIMDRLCYEKKAMCIINGESVGQVASQTLDSMNVINNVTNRVVIRPVACLDKLEIMDIAKKIDTYDISILPFEDCCTVFVPKHPVIAPKLANTLKQEEGFDFEPMIIKAIDNIITLNISENDKDKNEDLF